MHPEVTSENHEQNTGPQFEMNRGPVNEATIKNPHLQARQTQPGHEPAAMEEDASWSFSPPTCVHESGGGIQKAIQI